MPAAARVTDQTGHPGVITGPGASTVLIGRMPAARIGDAHACSFPGNPPHPPTTIVKGSGSVLRKGRPAARVGDMAACGASIVAGDFTVTIGG
jgi:uncharacterized Zn-binding protein involved in type VI secretion